MPVYGNGGKTFDRGGWKMGSPHSPRPHAPMLIGEPVYREQTPGGEIIYIKGDPGIGYYIEAQYNDYATFIEAHPGPPDDPRTMYGVLDANGVLHIYFWNTALNPPYWDELIGGDVILQSASDAQNAAENAEQFALDAAASAVNSAQSAGQSQAYAQQSQQSANDAQGYAQQAAQSANDAAVSAAQATTNGATAGAAAGTAAAAAVLSTKLDKTDVIDPATATASDIGKAADAYYTKQLNDNLVNFQLPNAINQHNMNELAHPSLQQKFNDIGQQISQTANDLQTQINALNGDSVAYSINFNQIFGTDTPTQAQIDAWLASLTPPVTPSVGTTIVNNDNTSTTYNHVYKYYSNPNGTGLVVNDDGAGAISTGSDTSLGVVGGGGAIGIDPDGNMSPKPGSITDSMIAQIGVSDAGQGSDTLISAAAKSLTAWFQGIRDNLKALFAHAHTGTDGTGRIDYNNLLNTPAAPGNGTLTITQGGTSIGTFSANQSANSPINIPAPGGGALNIYRVNGNASTELYSSGFTANSDTDKSYSLPYNQRLLYTCTLAANATSVSVTVGACYNNNDFFFPAPNSTDVNVLKAFAAAYVTGNLSGTTYTLTVRGTTPTVAIPLNIAVIKAGY